MLKDKINALATATWLQKVISTINRTVSDRDVTSVLADNRGALTALLKLVGAYCQAGAKVIGSVSDDEVKKLAPVIGHFIRGSLGKITRGLHEEAMVAVASLDSTGIENSPKLREAMDDAKGLVERTQREVDDAAKRATAKQEVPAA